MTVSFFRQLSFEGNKYVWTGETEVGCGQQAGHRGFGRAIVLKLADAGAVVFSGDLDEKGRRETADLAGDFSGERLKVRIFRYFRIEKYPKFYAGGLPTKGERAKIGPILS